MSSKKYGRTFHLPNSPGTANDDKIMTDLSALRGAAQVVVTEKMDGENTTIHSGGCHPRSPDARYHPSRDWMKAFAAAISPQLREDERIIGEYLYARHSIAYASLPSYFMGFSWIVGDVVQSWDATQQRFAELGIVSVPVLATALFSDRLIEEMVASMDYETQEGFVVRNSESFPEDDMGRQIAKYVRAGHVQGEVHWMKAALIPNGLA